MERTLSQGTSPTPQELFAQLAKNPDTTGWSDFISNPKGFFQDVSKVSKYSPELGKLATSNPSQYFASYDQFLKGTNQGAQPGGNGGTYRYDGDPSYYRPVVANSLGQWYDYKNNAFKNIGDGFGEKAPTGGSAPPSTQPVDTTPPVKKAKPQGQEYQYGNKNPYLENLLAMANPKRSSAPSPYGSASFRAQQPLKPGEYPNFKILRNLMGG